MEERELSMSSLLLLVGAFLIYSCTGIFTKLASMQETLVILTMGVYAILWQLILKRVDLAKAYLFKSLTVIFALFFAWSIFGEDITFKNMLGCAFIVSGIIINSCWQTE